MYPQMYIYSPDQLLYNISTEVTQITSQIATRHVTRCHFTPLFNVTNLFSLDISSKFMGNVWSYLC